MFDYTSIVLILIGLIALVLLGRYWIIPKINKWNRSMGMAEVFFTYAFILATLLIFAAGGLFVWLIMWLTS